VERRPESRKLELNGYLTKPTTRLARYPLLLEAVLKHTPEDHPDKTALPKVIGVVREFLRAVNAETGKAENRFNLLQLDQQLVFRAGEQVVSTYLLFGIQFCSTGFYRTCVFEKRVASWCTREL
jgi:RHO1 GDP-GTP exchange protein 1/2